MGVNKYILKFRELRSDPNTGFKEIEDLIIEAQEETKKSLFEGLRDKVNIDRFTLKGIDISWADVKEVFNKTAS